MSYGTPPPPPPPQPPYGGQPGQQPPYGGPAPQPYAHWGKRVAGYLIDSLIPLPLFVVAGIGAGLMGGEGGGAGLGVVLMALGYIGGFVVFVWNLSFRQGRTGQSIGKGVMNIRLLSEQTGQPVGAGMAFLRYIVHVVDSLACYIGWLWPLWDQKRQTFTDKILSTVVVEG